MIRIAHKRWSFSAKAFSPSLTWVKGLAYLQNCCQLWSYRFQHRSACWLCESAAQAELEVMWSDRYSAFSDTFSFLQVFFQVFLFCSCLTALLAWRRIKDTVSNRRFALFEHVFEGGEGLHMVFEIELILCLMITCLFLGENTPNRSLFKKRGAAQAKLGETVLWFHILLTIWTCLLTKAEISFLIFSTTATHSEHSALLSLWLQTSSLCPPPCCQPHTYTQFAESA